MEEDKDIHLIEAYLKGDLEKQEAAKFEIRLQNNQAFADTVDRYRAAYWTTEAVGAAHLKQQLQLIDAELQQDGKVSKMLRNIVIVAGVLVAIGLVVTISLIIPDEKPPPRLAVFMEMYGEYPATDDVHGNAPAMKVKWTSANNFYKQRKFNVAYNEFATLTQQDTTLGHLAHLYAGICVLSSATLDLKIAQAHFDAVLESNNSYHQQALWYLGMKDIILGDKHALQQHLQPLANNPTAYRHEDAQHILSVAPSWPIKEPVKREKALVHPK